MGEKQRPAMSLEEKENLMVDLAFRACEKRLRDGTATAQEIIHYLKLGSVRSQKEQKLLDQEIELKRVKREALEAAKNAEERYSAAIKAMGIYSGRAFEEDEDDSDLYGFD